MLLRRARQMLRRTMRQEIENVLFHDERDGPGPDDGGRGYGGGSDRGRGGAAPDRLVWRLRFRRRAAMRALGPGSVSSFLKTILDVVFFALWAGVILVGVLMLLALLLSFNPELIDNISMRAGAAEIANLGPVLVGGLAAAAIYMTGVLFIVERLRKIFMTLTAGDPFHPDNVRR